MRLAARVLFRRCRTVLITDLEWPAYRAILEQEARRTGRCLAEVPLRGALLEDHCTAQEVVRMIATAYHARGCEGTFSVPSPIRACVCRWRRSPAPVGRAEAPVVVIDGAQALGHAPADFSVEYCDFYLAGSHKWLQNAYPMGLGSAGVGARSPTFARPVRK